MSEYSVVTVGPSLVDMPIDCTDREEHLQRVQEAFGIKPGEYVRLDDQNDLSCVFNLLGYLHSPRAVPNDRQINLVAGSSNLGLLSALSNEVRAASCFVSSVGTTDDFHPDMYGNFFTTDLARLGIEHRPQLVRGHTPLGIILATDSHPDKTLFMYPGVSSEFSQFALIPSQAEVVYVDAYELVGSTKISRGLHQLVNRASHRIALGLGNHSILCDKLLNQIRHYIKSGKIFFLSGNEKEFAQLMGFSTDRLTDIQIRTVSEQVCVPHILLTRGDRGLVSIVNKVIAFQTAVEPQKIVNTSGAGDVAAGVFISGLLEGAAQQDTLYKSALHASAVLSLAGSKLENGRNDD